MLRPWPQPPGGAWPRDLGLCSASVALGPDGPGVGPGAAGPEQVAGACNLCLWSLCVPEGNKVLGTPPEPPASCDPARMSAWPSKVRAVGTVWEPAKCPPPCVHPQKTALPGSGDPAVDWGSLHRNRGVLPCPRLQLQTGEWEGKGPVRGGPRNASSQGP